MAEPGTPTRDSNKCKLEQVSEYTKLSRRFNDYYKPKNSFLPYLCGVIFWHKLFNWTPSTHLAPPLNRTHHRQLHTKKQEKLQSFIFSFNSKQFLFRQKLTKYSKNHTFRKSSNTDNKSIKWIIGSSGNCWFRHNRGRGSRRHYEWF